MPTFDNILDTKEFGANFLSVEQAALANLAGHYTGKEVNKPSSRLFQTYPARKIRPPMIDGCFVNAECKMVQILETGDHIQHSWGMSLTSPIPPGRVLSYTAIDDIGIAASLRKENVSST